MLKIGLDFANKITSVKNAHPLRRIFARKPSLATDVFEKTYSGDAHFKLQKTMNKLQIKNSNNAPLYECSLDFGKTQQQVYSKEGKKLYKIIYRHDGSYTKTNFDNNEKVTSLIEFAKDGGLISKKVIKELAQPPLKTELPKFIYHFTSVENYKSMQKSGVIRMGSDSHLSRNGNRAVFLVDEENLLTKWNNLLNGARGSYLSRLLKFCDKQKNNKVVMLKIPTDVLDVKKLAFRNQDVVMNDFAMFDLPQKEVDEYFAFSRLLKKNTLIEGVDSSGIAEDVYMPDRMRHLVDGQDIAELSDFRSFPLEILYRDDIPFDLIADARVIDTSEIAGMSLYDLETEFLSKKLIQDALAWE